ncbi:MAG TPA: ABC transporter ATP-binding protein [Bauldia sp.]|nr:ABC transporter ATP-binding protein [Bauldia sp.]
MIRVAGLTITFARGTPLEKTALDGIDLSVEAGEFVSIIGSNGAGKSTLLSALAGDFPPTSGRIFIDGVDVGRQPTARRSARVARVFQDPLAGSCGTLTIEENLALAAARGSRRGLGTALKQGRRAVFMERLKSLGLGLEGRMSDRMALLSGGQRQAIALVMATLAPSSVLLLDEHTAALDPGMAEFVTGLTRRIVEEHRLTTLMVTHSMRQALDLGTRTVMLHEGRIVLDVGGAERSRLTVEDLVAMFRRQRGKDLDDDELLIG